MWSMGIHHAGAAEPGRLQFLSSMSSSCTSSNSLQAPHVLAHSSSGIMPAMLLSTSAGRLVMVGDMLLERKFVLGCFN